MFSEIRQRKDYVIVGRSTVDRAIKYMVYIQWASFSFYPLWEENLLLSTHASICVCWEQVQDQVSNWYTSLKLVFYTLISMCPQPRICQIINLGSTTFFHNSFFARDKALQPAMIVSTSRPFQMCCHTFLAIYLLLSLCKIEIKPAVWPGRIRERYEYNIWSLLLEIIKILTHWGRGF